MDASLLRPKACRRERRYLAGEMIPASTRSRWAFLGSVLGAAALLAVAFQYSKADQAKRIVNDHAVVANADQARVASVTVRANLGVALGYLDLRNHASEPPETVEAAIAETQAAAANLKAAVETLSSDTTGVALNSKLAEFDERLMTTLEHLAAGNAIQAEEFALVKTIPALAELNQAVADIRNRAQVRIEVEGGQADLVARLAGFAVGLVAPALTAIALRRSSRLRQKRLLLEAELRREQDLLKTKDEFIGNLSHELRTPLTGIVGFAGTLSEILHGKQESGERAFLRETADLLVGEANTLTRMVDDLLTAMKAEENALFFQLEPIDVVAEVEAVLAPFRRGGLAIDVDMAPSNLMADQHRLRQVIRNLVSNSAAHGGPDIRLIGRVHGDLYQLTVADTGPGVPEHISERLFERFVHRGTEPLLTGSIGLGLAIVGMLVARMGGKIEYRREAGWTRFAVSLPVTDEVPKLGVKPSAETPPRGPKPALLPAPTPSFTTPAKLGERPAPHPS